MAPPGYWQYLREHRPDEYRRQLAAGKERKKRYQGTCAGCGRPTCGAAGRAKAPRFCVRCAGAMTGAKRRGRGSNQTRILHELAGGPMRMMELGRRVGMNKHTTSSTLHKMRTAGYIVRLERGLYALPLEAETQMHLPLLSVPSPSQ